MISMTMAANNRTGGFNGALTESEGYTARRIRFSAFFVANTVHSLPVRAYEYTVTG